MVDREQRNLEEMKTKILVCGSTGFIGRNVAESLAENHDYEVSGTFFGSAPYEHPRLRMVRADLTCKSDVAQVVRGMDIIIHAAAVTSGAKDTVTKPYCHVTDNAIMSALIFRAAYEYRVSHVVFFSCTTMYQSSDSPVKETDFDANQQVYPSYFGGAWTKVYNEKMCEFYARLGPAKYTVIRHSNIYGPYDKFDLERSHVFGATVTKVMGAEQGGQIVVWGRGEERRDLLYVSDLVAFVGAVLNRQSKRFEIFNAGYGSAISVRELVEKIIRYSGEQLEIEHDLTKPCVKTGLCLDSTRARKEIGWSPKVTLDEGIEKTLKWYRRNVAEVMPTAGSDSGQRQ